MRKTIYIAGKISGKTPGHVPLLLYLFRLAQFTARHIMLLIFGYSPSNPMLLISRNASYREQVEKGKELAANSKAIYLAHNWRKSSGAYREYRAFRRAGKKEVVYFRWVK